MANGLVAAALAYGAGDISSDGSGGGASVCATAPYGAVVDISRSDLEEVILPGRTVGGTNVYGEGHGDWEALPFWTEWSLEIFRCGDSGDGDGKGMVGPPLQRMFVRALPAELRVSTCVTDEMT